MLVVFPLPVGPVDRTIPNDLLNAFVTFLMSSSPIPRSASDILLERDESSLKTTFSPSTTGMIETLISRFSLSSFILILPSWGARCSSVLRLDIILILITIRSCRNIGSLRTSCKTPSILKRIRQCFSSGSI